MRRIGRTTVADEISTAMARAGYEVRETDPFTPDRVFAEIQTGTSALAMRIRGLWAAMRERVIDAFPEPRPIDSTDDYLKRVDSVYDHDAYHSLSIEGYRVTPELVARVRTGAWDPDRNPGDHETRAALAARGYWLAFQSVKKGIASILADAASAAWVRAPRHSG